MDESCFYLNHPAVAPLVYPLLRCRHSDSAEPFMVLGLPEVSNFILVVVSVRETWSASN